MAKEIIDCFAILDINICDSQFSELSLFSVYCSKRAEWENGEQKREDI